MPPYLFVLGDADRVREHLERHLFASNLVALKALSESLARAISGLATASEEIFEADVIMAAGDEILLRVATTRYSRERLLALGAIFLAETSCSLSFGVGASLAEAYVNLRIAKAEGGGRVADAMRSGT